MEISKEILFVSFTVALVYSGMTLIFPVLPFYLAEYGGGATEFGFAASAFAFAVLLFSPVMGKLADTHGKVPVIGYSLVGFAITNVLFVFVQSYWHIVILRFFEGMSTAGVAPVAISIASDLSSEAKRARSIAFVTAGISFGVIIGPLLGGTLILSFPLWFPFLISGLLGLMASIMAFKLLKEPNLPSPSDDTSLLDMNLSSRSVVYRAISSLPTPILAFGFVLLIQMILNLSWLLVEPGFVYYFYDDLGYNSQQFGIFVAAYGMFVFIGEIVLGGISDRFGRKIIIFVGSLIHGVFYVYLAFATDFLNLVLAGMVAGIALGLIGPALNALVSEVSHPEKRTYVFGVITAFAGVAQVLGPLIGGRVVDTGFPVTSLALVSAGLVFFSSVLVFFINFDQPVEDTKSEEDHFSYPEDTQVSLSD